MQERRRHPRYGIEIPVELRVGTAFRTLQTHDVSFRGLFVSTQTPPRPQQLVEVRLRLPPEDQIFRAHAMCTFVVQPDDDDEHPAGAGLRFYAVADEERRKWERFVRVLQQQVRESEAPPEDAAPPAEVSDAPPSELPDPVGEDAAGAPVSAAGGTRGAAEGEPLQFQPASLDELLHFSVTDLEKGVGFVYADQHVPSGSLLCVRVVHPETGGTFDLACLVDRTGCDHQGAPGLAVVFRDLDERVREDFRRFVYLGFTEIELTDVLPVEVPGTD
jgi:hypothetical protein